MTCQHFQEVSSTTINPLSANPTKWSNTFKHSKATEPLRGGSLLITTNFPEIPGTHLIDLRRIKG